MRMQSINKLEGGSLLISTSQADMAHGAYIPTIKAENPAQHPPEGTQSGTSDRG